MVDCISFIIVRDHGLSEALTIDENFRQAGSRALLQKAFCVRRVSFVLSKFRMWLQIIAVLLDGLLLRCPRCEHGHMFQKGCQTYHACPVCGLEFERASGEISGGMGINTVLTCLIEISLAIAFVFAPLPLIWEIIALVVVGIAFPIAFYRSSRGLWASLLYLTGSNTESD